MPITQRVAEAAAPATPLPPPRLPLSAVALTQDDLVHDLRRELAVVRHLVDALQCSVPLRPDLTRLTSDLAHEVAVLDDLVLSTGTSASQDAVDLVELVRGVVPGARAVHRGTVQVRWVPVPPVRASAVMLRRVVANLVVDACETASGGAVVITLGADAAWVTLDVDADVAAEDPATDRLGLGTWIVHAVVRDCGGAVERGRSPHGGRRVHVRLPVAAPGAA